MNSFTRLHSIKSKHPVGQLPHPATHYSFGFVENVDRIDSVRRCQI